MNRVIDAIADALSIVDTDARVMRSNAAWASLAREFGLPNDPTEGRLDAYLAKLGDTAAAGAVREALTALREGRATSVEAGCTLGAHGRAFALRVGPLTKGAASAVVTLHDGDGDGAGAVSALRPHEVVHKLPVGILVTDAEGRVVTYNAAGEAILGVRSEALAGTPVRALDIDMVDDEERPMRPDDYPIMRALATRQRQAGRILGMRRGGVVERWVLCEAAPDLDANGRVVAGYVSFLDVTDLQRARQRVVESEQKYRLLFDNMMSAFALHEILTDENGEPYDYRYLEVNPAFERLTGVPASAVIGRTLRETMPNTEDYWIKTFGKVALTGEPIAYENYSQELGRWYDTYTFSPRRGQFAVTFTDITARKRSEREVERSRAHLATAQRVASLGSWTWDSRERTCDWSDELRHLLGVSSDAPATLDGFFAALDPADRPRVEGQLRAALVSGAETSDRARLVRRDDGTARHVRIAGDGVRNDKGELCGYVTTVLDVTERDELEAQLRQAQKMEAIGRLAGGVAHDFNNLLTVIGLNVARLGEARADEPLNEIRSAVEQAANLTRQLLAFSRQAVIERVPLDVDEVIDGAMRMLTRIIGEDVLVERRLDRHLPRVSCDAGQLQQVLMNLAVNARDAMPRGGTLTIRTAAADVDASAAAKHGAGPGRYVTIEVRDDGVGMDEHTRARIFEPFFTTKEPGRGTGLGLATVFGIVHGWDGWIDVTSALGAGTTFRLYLPAAERQSEAPRPREGAKAAAGGHETILVVEDDAALARVTRTLLERAGYRVALTSDPRDAERLVAAHEGRIDLLICDVVMPGMSGPEVVERVHAHAPSLPVLFMTGYAPEAIQPGLAQHAVLSKPFTVGDLLGRVREVLERRR